jgi:hypothetical protein
MKGSIWKYDPIILLDFLLMPEEKGDKVLLLK